MGTKSCHELFYFDETILLARIASLFKRESRINFIEDCREDLLPLRIRSSDMLPNNGDKYLKTVYRTGQTSPFLSRMTNKSEMPNRASKSGRMSRISSES